MVKIADAPIGSGKGGGEGKLLRKLGGYLSTKDLLQFSAVLLYPRHLGAPFEDSYRGQKSMKRNLYTDFWAFDKNGAVVASGLNYTFKHARQAEWIAEKTLPSVNPDLEEEGAVLLRWEVDPSNNAHVYRTVTDEAIVRQANVIAASRVPHSEEVVPYEESTDYVKALKEGKAPAGPVEGGWGAIVDSEIPPPPF